MQILKIFGVLFFSLSCSQIKKLKPGKVYHTDLGFTYQVPMQGKWSRVNEPLLHRYVRHEKDSEIKIMAEVNFSQTDFGENLESFEKGLKETPNVTSSNYSIRKYKKTKCLFHIDRISLKKNKKLARSLMACMFPNDENRSVLMTMSQIVEKDEDFEDLTQDELAFFDSLKFD